MRLAAQAFTEPCLRKETIMENAITVTEGFWARCWRQATEAVYGAASHTKKMVKHAAKKVKAHTVTVWSWFTAKIQSLKAAIHANKEAILNKAAEAYNAVKHACAVAYIWVAFKLSSVVAAVKPVIVKAVEEATIAAMEAVQVIGLYFTVIWARIVEIFNVVSRYRNLVAVAVACGIMSYFGLPFVGTVATFIAFFLLFCIDITVSVNALKGEYQFYYGEGGKHVQQFEAAAA